MQPIIYPQKARNSQGSYLFIVNQDTFRQAVEVEQCLDEGSECLTDSDAPSSGSTVCRQEFATHRLYATSGSKSSSGPRSQLPTCRAGIQLNLPTTGDVKPAQISRPPQPLPQNFRDPSSPGNSNRRT